jgi:hypothetical protein
MGFPGKMFTWRSTAAAPTMFRSFQEGSLLRSFPNGSSSISLSNSFMLGVFAYGGVEKGRNYLLGIEPIRILG